MSHPRRVRLPRARKARASVLTTAVGAAIGAWVADLPGAVIGGVTGYLVGRRPDPLSEREWGR